MVWYKELHSTLWYRPKREKEKYCHKLYVIGNLYSVVIGDTIAGMEVKLVLREKH